MIKQHSDNRILNPEQKKAVEFGDGPLLIIAGAGTGKTTVVTERIKHLISSGRAKPQEILALTFTEKASREMEERIDLALPYGMTQMWISTFHSFCDRILRNEGLAIGLDPNFKLMTEAESIQFFRNNLFTFNLSYFRPLGNPTKFISGMLQHFSRLKDEDVDHAQYLEWVNAKHVAHVVIPAKAGIQRKKDFGSRVKPGMTQTDNDNTNREDDDVEKYSELAGAYRVYEELKTKHGVMDYGDLIAHTLHLFRTRKQILKKYQEQFRYILIDEFQDTNFSQNEIAILLAGKKQNITVVGDDDQCLPGDTLIAVPSGNTMICDIHKGDFVYTGVGKGYISQSKVSRVFKNKKKTEFISITTEKGKTIVATANHKMFCYVPKKIEKKKWHYVYLMLRKNLGWRIGTSTDLAVRLKLERSSDAIVGLRAYETEEEARYHELFWSLTYQIPTSIFKERDSVMMQGKLVEQLYKEFDTDKNARRLAKDLGINIDAYHYLLDGVTRGKSERIVIHLKMCQRKYTLKHAEKRIIANTKVSHIVYTETSNPTLIKLIQDHNISYSKAKKGIRVRYQSADLKKVGVFARKLIDCTGGFLEVTSDIGKLRNVHTSSVVMPAGNLLPGHMIPIRVNNHIYYDEIIKMERQEKTEIVYDLEIEKTHNFIANDIVVHNSIYKWRGAAVSNMLQFRKQFKKARIVVLTKNYRSTKVILDRSYEMIQNNNPDRLEVAEKIEKKLECMRRVSGTPIHFIYEDRVEDEAENTVSGIKYLVSHLRQGFGGQASIKNDESKYSWKDIAILVRANSHAEPFIRALSRQGIPYQFLGPGQLFRQAEVKDLICYLKVLYDISDTVSLFRVLSMDHFQIPSRDIAALISFARQHGMSLFEVCESIHGGDVAGIARSNSRVLRSLPLEDTRGRAPSAKNSNLSALPATDNGIISSRRGKDSQNILIEKPFITSDGEEKIRKLFSIILKHLGKMKKESAGQILYFFLEESGLLQSFASYKTVKEERVAENVAKFFDKLKTYESDHDDASVFAVVDWLELCMTLGESPLATNSDWNTFDAVNILTVHSAKGLEFPIVFIVNLVAARFPTTEKHEQIPIPDALIKEILPEGDYHTEEERRLYYVAMTRARDHLYLTAAKYYGEGKREKKISPFITETVDEETVRSASPSGRQEDDKTEEKQLFLIDWQKTNEPEVSEVRRPVTYLSYSQVETFERCPLQYKYRYILKIPVPTSAALSFGDTIHRTLRRFYEMKNTNLTVDVKVLLNIYEKEWVAFGYKDRVYEEKMKMHGVELLKEYFEKGFDPAITVLQLEQPFKIRLTQELVMGGKIDRVDRTKDGKLEIIDYKTGSAPKKRDPKTDKQLSVYALAATEKGLYGEKPENVIVSFYFLEGQEKISATRVEEQLEEVRKDVLNIADAISKSVFPPTPGMHCDFCEFRLICEAWK